MGTHAARGRKLTVTRASISTHADATSPDAASIMRRIGLALLLIPLFARAMSLLSMVPGWDLDPLIMPVPFSGIGPAESITLDCAALLGAAIMALFAPRRTTRAEGVAVALLAIGAAGVLAHMATWSGIGGAGSLGDRRIGIAWLSAMLGGVSLWLCRRDDSLRRIAAAVLLGFVGMLLAKAALQVFVEHPQTVEAYRANPARFLAGQGLLPDTPMARAFERRLLQPEATGWFGLANVFATIMAASTVTAAAFVAIAQLRRPRLSPVPTAIIAVTALATLLGLSAAGAKGGALAAAVGFTGLLLSVACSKLALTTRSRNLLGSAFGLAAVVGPIALILIRGQIGERMSELSLLFRWFYMQGAARIFAAHPMGVGPDGFQQAYLLAKPPISPEEVTSPHSITFDWLADLGIPGFAWVAVLLIAAAAIGRVLTASTASLPASPPGTPSASPTDRNELRLILLIPGLATLLAAWLERGAVTPDGALVRLLGLFGWCAIAWAVLNLARAIPSWPIAFAAGAAALLAHIQIDVAASWPQSVGLIALWLALACSRSFAEAAATSSSFPRFLTAFPIAILACLAIALSAPTQVWRWQSALLAANAQLGDVADLNARFSALADGSSTENPSAIAASLSAALARREPGQHSPPRNTDELRSAMARLEFLALADAAAALRATARIEPSEWRVRREASRLLIRAAAAANAAGDAPLAGKLLDDSIAALELPNPAPPAPSDTHSRTTSPEWRWLAIVWSESARNTDDPALQSLRLAHAAAALNRAAGLDPYNLEIALRLMRVYTQIGDPANAARWAHKVLELDPLMRLDQAARGLTDSERAEAQRTARSP